MDSCEKIAQNKQTSRCRLTVVIVRHGERLDYVHRAAGRNWCQANPEQPWNPPLTEKGLAMATQLGAAMREHILPDLGLPPISAVYTSPFLRCRQTAAGIIQGFSSRLTTDMERSDSNRNSIDSSALKVRVELGLAESMNEDWYRSWSLPGTDGTWGYKRKEIPHIDPARDRMDPRALQPVETLLDWKKSIGDTHGILDDMMDHQYKSCTSLGDYSFAGNPPKLESADLQRTRITNTMNILRNRHHNQLSTKNENVDKKNEKTIVFVAHGGIVSQFYVNLTGNDSKKHGFGKYCCYSIYQNEKEVIDSNVEKECIWNKKWTPLVVNQVLWDEREEA